MKDKAITFLKSPKAIIAAGVILFALFVWPTLYKYEKTDRGREHCLVRVNRITGTTYILMQNYKNNSENPQWTLVK